MKRTKIVATLGPATSSPKMIEELIKTGVNAFRLNFSHGTHESHAQLIEWIKEKRKALDTPVAILQDLSGPKIRIGNINRSALELNSGDELIFDTQIEESSGNIVPVSYKGFADDVQQGHHLLLADGNLEIEVTRLDPPRVTSKVVVGGQLTSNKGINYPEGSFNLPAITEKDKKDLRFGLRNGVDCVALSFVKAADDVKIARKICESENRHVPLIAKIEKHEAIKNLYEILQCVDGVMVARGDLGVEIPLEQVPLVQKRVIKLANSSGKPVITATQMLVSMVDAPRPTRAEATDITNAILDGTDAIMLSEETATGNYPLQAVRTMNQIALETEKSFPYYKASLFDREISVIDITLGISSSAASLAKNLDARAILCPTSSGFTARMISRFRPKARVIALTPNEDTYFQSSLLWGVYPTHFPVDQNMDNLVREALSFAQKRKFLQPKDRYVLTAGFPFGKGGKTNLITAGQVT